MDTVGIAVLIMNQKERLLRVDHTPPLNGFDDDGSVLELTMPMSSIELGLIS